MTRSLALVVGLLGLALALWLFLGGNDDVPVSGAETGDRQEAERERDPGADLQANAEADKIENPTESNESAEREAVRGPEESRFEEIPDHDAVRVSIRHRTSGAPATGAVVRYLGMVALDAVPQDTRLRMSKERWPIAKTIREFGFRARVDAEGIATIRRDPGRVFVDARLGELFDSLTIKVEDAEPKGGWQMLLRPVAAVLLRVVDEDDKGVPNVALAAQFSGRYSGKPQTVVQPIGETNPDGVFTTELASFLKSYSDRTEAEDARLVLNIPGLRNVGVDIDLAEARAEKEIIMPSTGRIRCEIVDAIGKPATGVWGVNLYVQDQSGVWTNRPDASGSIPGFDRVALGAHYRLSAQLRDGSAEVSIDGPTEPDQEVVARIELPPMGRIVIKLTDSAGNPFVSIGNYLDLVAEGGRSMQRRFDDKGVALFEHVPLGKKFEARIDRPNMQKKVVGPVSTAEEVVVNVAIDPGEPILAARLVDAKGSPLPGQRVRLKLKLRGGSAERILVCDPKGEFFVPLGMRGRELEVVNAVMRAVDDRGDILRGSARLQIPKKLPGGVTHLGDIVFTTRPILLSGQLVGLQTRKRYGLPIRIERHQIYQSRGVRRERWRQDETMHVIWTATDKFEYRGEAEPGRRRLTLSAPGFLPIEPIEFELGTEDLKIPMTRGGSLAVRVKADESIDHQMILAQLVPTGGPSTPAVQRGTQRSQRSMLGRRGTGELNYRWVGLIPGVYRFELTLIGATQPLVAVDEIEIAGGAENRDTRLQDLDLRGKVRSILVSLAAPDGKPVSRVRGMVLVRPPGELTDIEGRSFDYQSSVKLAIGNSPVDLLVVVEGYPVKELTAVDRDTKVQLDAPRSIRIKLTGKPLKIPSRAKLRLWLTSDFESPYDRVRYRADFSSGGLGHYFDSRGSATFENGQAVCSVPRPGTHRVGCQLQGLGRPRAVTSSLKTIEVRDVAEEQVFEISIDQATIDAAVQKGK